MQRKLDQQGAESVAIQALTHLAQDPERLGRFLSETGIEPSEIRVAAGQPGFLLAVLEHFCADESYLLAYTANSRISPEMVDSARQCLSALAAPQDDFG
jgi:hypothetical protein